MNRIPSDNTYKVCSLCSRVLDSENTVNSRCGRCKPCYNRLRRERYKNNTERELLNDVKSRIKKDKKYKSRKYPNLLLCKHCNTLKDRDTDFYKVKGVILSKSMCRSCNNSKKRTRRRESFILTTKNRLRSRLSAALKSVQSNPNTKSISSKSKTYGIDFLAIVKYIGDPPDKNQNWTIDHILPLSAFDYSDPEMIRISFLPENHQWMLMTENISKSDFYDPNELRAYIKRHYQAKA